jgi:hypothetical protein
MILNQFKALIVGEDPLNVHKLYHKMLMRSAGQGAIEASPSPPPAASRSLCGIWKETPDNVEDQGHWRAQCQGMMAEKFGWTAFKVQGDGIPPKADPDYKEPSHDPYTRGTPADSPTATWSTDWPSAVLP